MAGKDHDLLAELNTKTYANQAKWFLNTLWGDRFESNADAREEVWNFTQNMIKLDKIKGKKGSGLTEIIAHIFLEKNTETQTWTEFRDKMREIGFEHAQVSLLNFFIFNYKLDASKLVNSVSGMDEDAEVQIQKAQDKLDAAQQALDTSVLAEAESKEAANEAAKALAAQQQAESAVKAGMEAIKAEEEKKAKKLAKLKARSENESLGTVKMGVAFQQFKRLEGEDPLPLRKAKLEQGAKVRKMKKATKKLKKAEAKAQAKKEAAIKAVQDARDALAAAETFLVEVKAACSGGSNDGILWWMDRELTEARKYLPKGKAAAMERRVKKQQKKLKRRNKNKKAGSVTAAQSGNLMMEIEGEKKKELKKTETRGEGVSDAVKAAFVADANGEAVHDEEVVPNEE
jgi:hypothetical protein